MTFPEFILGAIVIASGLFFLLTDRKFLWKFGQGQGDPPESWSATATGIGIFLIFLGLFAWFAT